MKPKKILNLYSEKPEVIDILENFKKNNKLFYRIIEALQLMGNFPKQVEIDVYEKEISEEKEYIKIYCYDSEGNIFIFCPLSTNKQDTTKIEKITNGSTCTYDLMLLKNFPLTKDNIEYSKTAKIYDFKFGRLITDEKSFYSLFMMNNLGYQIEIEFADKAISAKELINELNKLDKIPDMMEFAEIFYQLILEKQLLFYDVSLSMFKDFERKEHIKIEGNKHKKRVLTK